MLSITLGGSFKQSDLLQKKTYIHRIPNQTMLGILIYLLTPRYIVGEKLTVQ